jgi:hypothetical protein
VSTLALATALLLAAGTAQPATPKAAPTAPKPVAASQKIVLPADRTHPLVASPSLSPDGQRVFLSRFVKAGQLQHQGEISAVDLGTHPKVTPLPAPGPNEGNRLRLFVSPDGKSVAYLASGELWVRPVDSGEARRLYPPAEGEAPLGPQLSHACWAPDSKAFLVQSPKGWGHVLAATGEFGALAMPPIDLSVGSLAFSSDGLHAMFVKGQSGTAWVNGAKVVVVNVETNFAQVVDATHLYTEVLFLPDGTPLAKDVEGTLWALHAQTRFLYFKPPSVPATSEVGQYTLSRDFSRLAYVVSERDRDGQTLRTELWAGGAPPVPVMPATPKPVE